MNRLLLAGAAVLAIAGLGSLGMSYRDREVPAERPPAERPTLALVTSLPLVFGESFSLEGGGSPALTRLEQRYRVLPIGVTDASSLRGQRLLLMAHPRAQPAEALVQLDRWVRGGGHLLLLADPRLDWPSDRPLGDKLRPPPAYADTGLLAHWGLSLSGPKPDSATAGRLAGGGACKVREDGLVARCRIGRGVATVIADADFLNASEPDTSGLDLLVIELDRLETR